MELRKYRGLPPGTRLSEYLDPAELSLIGRYERPAICMWFKLLKLVKDLRTKKCIDGHMTDNLCKNLSKALDGHHGLDKIRNPPTLFRCEG